jgi:5-methyltetrahydropteroyltriglutamate--homocysteine methyltransferase
MNRSSERILVTHTGSLPRPPGLTDRHDLGAVRAAVRETVARQLAAGVDVISDGEMSKSGYSTYVTERLSGFNGEPAPVRLWGYEQFPEYARKHWGGDDAASSRAVAGNPTCDGPVTYLDLSPVQADIANLREPAAERRAEAFMTAASPGVIEMFMPNRYYPSSEDYLGALADAMKLEYDAIHQSGLILQLDCPDLAADWVNGSEPRTLAEFRKAIAVRLEALDYATRDIPPDAMRMHLCWGNYEGPHHTDIPLADIIDLVLRARPGAVSLEGANPRHEHEWQVFEDVKLPDGKILIPGVIDSTNNYVEHPELVAQRISRYARLVGRENVIAGSDCGFATFADYVIVEPEITWAKLAAMADGARAASQRLWGHSS